MVSIERLVNKTCECFSRYSKDLNGFRATSTDLEFVIVENYKMYFHF